MLRGRVTNEAGAPLADVRVRVAIPATDMRFVDAGERDSSRVTDHKLHKLLEARSDARGDYRLEIPGIAERTTDLDRCDEARLSPVSGNLDVRRRPEGRRGRAGQAAEASLILKPALYFAGIVVDEHGKPIPGVEIVANAAFGTAGGGVERTVSHSDGSFELFNYPVKPRVIR